MLMAAPVPARAADLQVSFTLGSLKVSGYKPTDVVTLQGTVRNDGDVPAYGVQAILWRSRDEIRDLATLRQASSSTVLGSRLPISPDHYVVVSTSSEGFAPGESQQVTLRATMAELGFDTRGVAFPLGADVIANADPGPVSDYHSVGQLRTFVAVPGRTKVPVTSIVLLTATPTKLVDNLFRNDSLAADLNGRLDLLLDAAARPGMGWLIDPALLDEVRDMADGYQVDAGGTVAPGAGQDAAKAWLAKFDALDDDNGGRTLFANPDVTGARAAKDVLAIVRSERAAATVSGLDDLPLVVVPGQTQVSAATYEFIAESSADAVIVTNTTAAGALQSGLGGQPKVLGASAAVPGSPETPPLQRRQFALATAVVAGAAGEVRLLRTPSDVEQDASAIGSWLVRRSLGELLESTPSVSRLGLVTAKPARLDADAFAELHRLDSDFTAYAELAPASLLTAQSDAAVSRATSSSWIGDDKGFDAQLDGLDKLVGLPSLGRSVTLYASPRFVMSSRANQFPVTVTNKLTEEIRVKVVIDTENRNRLNVPDTEVVEVEPGQSVTMNIRPEASSNGLVAARAHIATASGRRIGPDIAITVEVTDLGVVAWIIVGASGLVLLGATAWRIRQVRRRTAVAETPGAGE
jgi:hypothetical protein